MIAEGRNKLADKCTTVVVNGFIVDKVRFSDLAVNAKKANLDSSTFPTVDLILFLTHVESHWIIYRYIPKDKYSTILRLGEKGQKPLTRRRTYIY